MYWGKNDTRLISTAFVLLASCSEPEPSEGHCSCSSVFFIHSFQFFSWFSKPKQTQTLSSFQPAVAFEHSCHSALWFPMFLKAVEGLEKVVNGRFLRNIHLPQILVANSADGVLSSEQDIKMSSCLREAIKRCSSPFNKGSNEVFCLLSKFQISLMTCARHCEKPHQWMLDFC